MDIRLVQTIARGASGDAATSRQAIRGFQDVSTIAAAYGINVRSMFRWLVDFANGGQHAMLATPIPRRCIVPNPPINLIGEIFLSPTAVSICLYLTLLMQKLVNFNIPILSITRIWRQNA